MSDFHHTPQWQRARAAVKKHYKGLCANPFGLHSFAGMITPNGQPTAANVIHHIIPVDVDISKATDIQNLIPLCNRCHERAHNLLEHLGVNGIILYRKAFNLPPDVCLTSKEKPPQHFFSRNDCFQIDKEKFFCARCNRERTLPCPTCKTFNQSFFQKKA